MLKSFQFFLILPIFLNLPIFQFFKLSNYRFYLSYISVFPYFPHNPNYLFSIYQLSFLIPLCHQICIYPTFSFIFSFSFIPIFSQYFIFFLYSCTDMEKDEIFPRTRFVNNQNFHKKYISKFLTITRIIVEIIIHRL